MFCYSCWLCDEAFPAVGRACKHTAAVIETHNNAAVFAFIPHVPTNCSHVAHICATTRLPVFGSSPSVRNDTETLITSQRSGRQRFLPLNRGRSVTHMPPMSPFITNVSLCFCFCFIIISVLRQTCSCLFLVMLQFYSTQKDVCLLDVIPK